MSRRRLLELRSFWYQKSTQQWLFMWTNPDPCRKLITSDLLFNCRSVRLTEILFPTLILEHNDQTTLPLCLDSFSLLFTGQQVPLVSSGFPLQLSSNFTLNLFPSVNMLLRLLLPSSASWLHFCILCATAYSGCTHLHPPCLVAKRGQCSGICKARFCPQFPQL